jgi:RNA recognition motif-containing protein
MNIYVSNLSNNTTGDNLKELFAQYGNTVSVNVITDKYTGFPRGFGFVEMPDNSEGEKAIEALNETEFQGNIITVNVARPRPERSDRGRENRTGGGFNRKRY